jgi:type I restriction enzyme R subunit
VAPPGATSSLDPITENGLRDPRDKQKVHLVEQMEKLNNALGDGISDASDKAALAVHIAEKLRGDGGAQNSAKEQALKASLPQEAVQITVCGMQSQHGKAIRLLVDESCANSYDRPSRKVL